MLKLALSLVLAACLAACATTPEATAARAARLEAADTITDAAVARYCALHPLARAALRAQVTAGVPVILCPDDLRSGPAAQP
jgi:hypothetical protein